MKSNTFCRERTARRLLSVLLMLVITMFSVLPAAAEEGAAEAASYADPAVMPSNATEGWPKAADTVSDFVCVMDAGTGAILCEKGMDVETPPASLTKIMTTLVAIASTAKSQMPVPMIFPASSPSPAPIHMPSICAAFSSART